MSEQQPVVYRLAPAVVARFVGLAFVAVALLLFAVTLVVALLDLTPDLIVIAAAVAVVAVLGLGWWLRSRAYVVRCTREGYQVRLVRGAGVREARWNQVEDAVTTVRRDVPCVELRLKDGRVTTIPATILDVDREEFVRRLQDHLQVGNGLRPRRRPRR